LRLRKFQGAHVSHFTTIFLLSPRLRLQISKIPTQIIKSLVNWMSAILWRSYYNDFPPLFKMWVASDRHGQLIRHLCSPKQTTQGHSIRISPVVISEAVFNLLQSLISSSWVSEWPFKNYRKPPRIHWLSVI
jgi:hypothetical protein